MKASSQWIILLGLVALLAGVSLSMKGPIQCVGE